MWPHDKANPHAVVRTLLQRIVADPEVLLQLPVQELDLALRIARRARLLGYLDRRLAASRTPDVLPQAARDQFDSARAMVDARARMARWELDRIAWALQDEGDLPVIILKGSAYLLLDLPNAAGRVFVDVDLLVPEADLAHVESRLRQPGWHGPAMSPHNQKFYREWMHEVPALVHSEREVEVDVHFRILPRRARLKPSPDALIAGSQLIPGSRYRVLADTDIVLHAMVHLLFSGDLADSVRDLLDIHLLLDHYGAADPAFWSRLTARAAELDLLRPTWYSLRYARRLLGTAVPAVVDQATHDWGPNHRMRRVMDHLVPRALFPLHPDSTGRWLHCCRQLLLVHQNWIRLPPHLLITIWAVRGCCPWTAAGKEVLASSSTPTTPSRFVEIVYKPQYSLFIVHI